jgi:hypothetical protein
VLFEASGEAGVWPTAAWDAATKRPSTIETVNDPHSTRINLSLGSLNLIDEPSASKDSLKYTAVIEK